MNLFMHRYGLMFAAWCEFRPSHWEVNGSEQSHLSISGLFYAILDGSCRKEYALKIVPTCISNGSILSAITKTLETWINWHLIGSVGSRLEGRSESDNGNHPWQEGLWGLSEITEGLVLLIKFPGLLRACEYFTMKSISKLKEQPQSVCENRK